MSLRFASKLLWAIVACGLWVAPAQATTLVFEDGVFDPTDWSFQLFNFHTGGSATPSQALVGGNPGTGQEVAYATNAAADAADNAAIYVFHGFAGAVVAPSLEGAIASVDYFWDVKAVTGGGVFSGPALLQGGNVYVSAGLLELTGTSPLWRSVDRVGVLEVNFGRIQDLLEIDPGQDPDFSASGAPITFGYFSAFAGALGGGPASATGAFDNWRVDVQLVPEPGLLASLGLAAWVVAAAGRARAFTLMALALLLLPGPARAERELPRRDDPSVVRQTTVTIDSETVRRWADARAGDELVLPSFDGEQIAATVDCTRPVGGFHNVFADVVDAGQGDVVLTLGGDEFVGSLYVDGQTFRYQRLAGDRYSLEEIDVGQLMPDARDTDEPDLTPGPARPPNVGPLGRGQAVRLPERTLFRFLDRQAARAPELSGPDDGSRIDVLVGFSTEAEAWAGGQDRMLMEIVNLFAKANEAYEQSGVVVRLNPVGFWRVSHTVDDPGSLEDDAFMLRNGVGDLAELHTLRDELRADLVSLLVLNAGDAPGDDGCGGDTGRACGYGFTQRDFPGPGDVPGTEDWDEKFARDGFSVSHVKAAVKAWTFHHEISHNLGAHHDSYTFFQQGTKATADAFARGFILWASKRRTLMAYDTLCQAAGFSCSIENRISNPNLPAGSNEWWGSPVPGGTDGSFRPDGVLGAADNARAINRMAWTVANYRRVDAP